MNSSNGRGQGLNTVIASPAFLIRIVISCLFKCSMCLLLHNFIKFGFPESAIKFHSFIFRENPDYFGMGACTLMHSMWFYVIRGSTKNYFKDRHVLGLNTATARSYAKRSVYEFYVTLRILRKRRLDFHDCFCYIYRTRPGYEIPI